MQVHETHSSVDNNCQISSGWYDWPYCDDIGEVFREAQAEHGRCISKVYRDVPLAQDIEPYTETGSPMFASYPEHIGWCFQKRKRYSDCNDSYLHEAWITWR